MPTMLVKNVSQELLRELKRLKMELGCKTWAELLELLVRLGPKEIFSLSKDEVETIKEGVKGFIGLRETVSKRWSGPPSVVDEFRKQRRHEGY
jgi:hypothetical protein